MRAGFESRQRWCLRSALARAAAPLRRRSQAARLQCPASRCEGRHLTPTRPRANTKQSTRSCKIANASRLCRATNGAASVCALRLARRNSVTICRALQRAVFASRTRATTRLERVRQRVATATSPRSSRIAAQHATEAKLGGKVVTITRRASSNLMWRVHAPAAQVAQWYGNTRHKSRLARSGSRQVSCGTRHSATTNAAHWPEPPSLLSSEKQLVAPIELAAYGVAATSFAANRMMGCPRAHRTPRHTIRARPN